MDQFLIGNILVQMDYAGVPVLPEGNLRLFTHEGNREADRIVLNCSSEPLSPYLTSPLTEENHVYGIYSHEGQQCLVYHWGNLLHGFAVWPERFAVTMDPRMYHQPPLRMDWFFSVCSFHRQLLIRDACVLHASYVDIGGQAILFTGPSNIGKSTQANLWSQFEGAEVINGDRAVLRKIDGKWHVFGYPCCGTSGICINRNLPLRAIVVLNQANENTVQQLTPASKIRALTAAMELYPWDGTEVDMAFHIAAEIASQVPVLKLSCRPDREAVDVLKKYLEEDAGDDLI